MNPLEMLLISLIMISQGAVVDVKKENVTLDLSAPNVIVEITMCNPLVPKSLTRQRPTIFIRCITNDRQWDEGWTARPEQGGVLVWRAIVVGPHSPKIKAPKKTERKKKSKKKFRFQQLNETEI